MFEITESTIEEIKDLIVKKISPIKIILFGSRATGKERGDSDLDLFIIVSSSDDRRMLEKEVRLLLSKYIFGKDILVFTPREVEEWKDVPGAFVHTVLKEGKTLYAKAA